MCGDYQMMEFVVSIINMVLMPHCATSNLLGGADHSQSRTYGSDIIHCGEDKVGGLFRLRGGLTGSQLLMEGAFR